MLDSIFVDIVESVCLSTEKRTVMLMTVVHLTNVWISTNVFLLSYWSIGSARKL